MNKNTYIFFIISLFTLTSCKIKEKASDLNYLQNAEQIATETAIKNQQYTIQPGDQINVYVSAKNMEVVKPFNQLYYSSQSPSVNNNTPATEKAYIVDSKGNIDFPILGEITTSNKTIEELKEELTLGISKYVKNPNVTVRLVNFKVTVLGEVNRPNQYQMTETNPNILNALGAAGDLTMYGRRNDVLVVRNVDGEIQKERINLLDANFINSPFFQLRQGDVIFVSANNTKEKTSRLDPNTGTYIAIAGTVIGLAGIFITIFKN